MTNSARRPFGEVVESIKKLYREYSLYDVVTALFVSSLWLPNIASQVKHMLFAASLCSTKPAEFQATSAIRNYVDFRQFLEELYKLAPSFMTLEDYVPELDWGDVKFPFRKKNYRIFYGGDLSNAYDHLSLFQILYGPLDQKFIDLVRRSPLDELQRLLTLQDMIIMSISSQPARDCIDVSPGATNAPSERFWREALRTYQSLNLEDIVGEVLLKKFSTTLGKLPPEILLEQNFGEAVRDGLTFRTLFVESGGRYFLILPRRMTGVLFDAWGELLKRHESSLPNSERPLELEIAGGFCHFVKERFSEDDALLFVSARSGNRDAHEVIFPVAIPSKDKLVLFHLLPPATDEDALGLKLAEISPKLKEAIQLLKKPPTQLILHLKNQRIEFSLNRSEGTMTPVLFIVIPPTYTGGFSVKLKEDPPGRVEFMDSVISILDELHKVEELSDFLDYLETLEETPMSPFSSLFDKFATFRDSHGVLIGGALTPTMVMLDPHWGSQYRYQSLAKFWNLYPEKDFFGHPRSWRIIEEGPRRIRLEARSYFGCVLHCEIGKTHAFLTAPFDAMSYEQGKIANFLMECAEDNLYLCCDVVGRHKVFDRYQEVLVQIFPRSLVTAHPDFKHLLHLDPGAKPWCADAGFPNRGTVGVRIVFSEDVVKESFLDTQDRSMEAELLLEIVNQLDSLCRDPKIKDITDVIEKAKIEKPRFKFFTEKKPASFPELAKLCLPSTRSLKLAKKRIAELAKQVSVSEGNYDLAIAKDRLNVLRKAMVTEINRVVEGFDFARSAQRLIEWADALADKRERDRMTIEHSLEHDVDYSREERYSENEKEFIRTHRNYRYLIEKFVQLQPKGKEVISEESTRLLLALTDWFFVIAEASNVIHYEIGPASLKIDHEFLVEVEYRDDAEAGQTQFAQEQAQLRLGLIGNAKDTLQHPESVEEQMVALDDAFREDFGFGFTNLVSVLIVLAHWPEQHDGVVETASYSATRDEIASAAQNAIETLSAKEIDPLLDFLTLKSDEVLRVLKGHGPCDDLPVWEHKKRFARYTIKPLIKLGERYYWGPYSARTAGIIWSGSPSLGTLPVDIGKACTNRLLRHWKQLLDSAVEAKAAEIVKRFTPHVIPNAELHRLDREGKHPRDLGDYDVLAYCPKAHAILNIECKNLLPVYCLKDAKTLRETIFGEPGKDEGHFRQIDKRQRYLVEHWTRIAGALKWPLSSTESPNIVSLYVTPTAYWWTRFPPLKVCTTFVQIQLLSKFIEELGA